MAEIVPLPIARITPDSTDNSRLRFLGQPAPKAAAIEPEDLGELFPRMAH